MQAQTPDINSVELPQIQLSLRDLAVILIKEFGYHQGLFDLSIEFQIGIGGVGPDPTSQIPGAMIGVSKIGLLNAKSFGPTTVDASVVNPPKKPKKINPKV